MRSKIEQMFKSLPTSDDAQPTEWRVRLAAWLVTATLFMEILDGTIITTALPDIAQSFGTSALRLNVGISAYLLAVGVFIPISGWIADRFGTRRIFAAAIGLFVVSSMGCGAATGVASFVVMRITQGIAGAMMVPVGRLVVMRSTPRDRLMATMSALVWPALIAPVLGPPLGGLITTYLGWRWIFYMNAPIGFVALIGALIVVPELRAAVSRRFDVAGFLLTGGGTLALLTGLEWTQGRLSLVAVTLVIAGLLMLIAAIRHLARTPEPMIGLASYRIATFRAALRGGTVCRMAIGSAPFLLPLLFQIGFHYDAVRSGMLLLALFAGNLAMKTVTTRILRRFGYRSVMLGNGLLTAATLGACAFLSPTTPIAITVCLLIASGAARSLQFTALATIAFADVPKLQMSDANALSNTVFQVSASLGITLSALAVRAGEALVAGTAWAEPAFGYRFALCALAALTLVGLMDVAVLPSDAGDGFVKRARQEQI